MAQYLDVVSSTDKATTPDAAALDITGDLDARWDVALDDYTPASNFIFGRYTTAGNARIWRPGQVSSGKMKFVYGLTDGTNVRMTHESSVALSINDGVRLQFRTVSDIDDGSSNTDTLFYTRTNLSLDLEIDTGWVQLGTTQQTAGVHTWNTNAAELLVGGTPLTGKYYRALYLDGQNGVVVADFNAEDFNVGDVSSATAVSATSGETWTLSGGGAEIKADPAGTLYDANLFGPGHVLYT